MKKQRPSSDTVAMTMSQARAVARGSSQPGHSGSCCSECQDGRPCAGTSSRSRPPLITSPSLLLRANLDMNAADVSPQLRRDVLPAVPHAANFRALNLLQGGSARPVIPGTFKLPSRPTAGCDHGDIPGPQHCDPPDPEEETKKPARFPQYLGRDCSPSFYARQPKLSGECSGIFGAFTSLAGNLFGIHQRAYEIVKCAYRTVAWISRLNGPSQEFFWDWAGPQFSGFFAWWGADRTPQARLSSLAHWFGPYSYNSISTVKNTFGRMVDAYENGAHTILRPTLTYHCVIVCPDGVPAQNWTERYTRICPPFWDGCCSGLDTPWGRSRVWMIAHEWFHGIRSFNRPHDLCAQPCDSGATGWKCKFGEGHSHQCYQLDATRFSWDLAASGGGPPRQLAEAGRIQDTLDNIDNFISWAIARWVDPQWGRCDGPRPLPDGFSA
jgi:hypothetical protein